MLSSNFGCKTKMQSVEITLVHLVPCYERKFLLAWLRWQFFSCLPTSLLGRHQSVLSLYEGCTHFVLSLKSLHSGKKNVIFSQLQ
jgi:hypothetical protein